MLRTSVVSRSRTQSTLCPSPDMQPLSLRLAVPRPCLARCNSRGTLPLSAQWLPAMHRGHPMLAYGTRYLFLVQRAHVAQPAHVASSPLMSPPPEPQGSSLR